MTHYPPNRLSALTFRSRLFPLAVKDSESSLGLPVIRVKFDQLGSVARYFGQRHSLGNLVQLLFGSGDLRFQLDRRRSLALVLLDNLDSRCFRGRSSRLPFTARFRFSRRRRRLIS